MANGTLQVLDYSFSRIDHALAHAHGVVGCMRYLYGNGKGLTPTEVALFRSSGLSLGLNYEAGPGDFVGRSAGVGQATAAYRFAQSLGLGGHPIIFSADFDVPRSKFAAIGDAVDGALSVLGDGNVGVYGKADLIDYLFGRFGNRIFYWQTYAWSSGRRSAHADLYQFRNGQDFAGGQVDFNEITGRTFWAIANGHTTQGGTATPITEDDMTPAQATQLSELFRMVSLLVTAGSGKQARTATEAATVTKLATLLDTTPAELTEIRRLAGVAVGYPGAGDRETGPAKAFAAAQVVTAPGGISDRIASLQAAIAHVSGGGTAGDVDVPTLATALVTQLGQPLAIELAKHLTLTATVKGA